jgi:hypothetical protein
MYLVCYSCTACIGGFDQIGSLFVGINRKCIDNRFGRVTESPILIRLIREFRENFEMSKYLQVQYLSRHVAMPYNKARYELKDCCSVCL